MCNDPHPIRTGLSLDPWEIGELEARSSIPLCQVAASPPPDDQSPSEECHACQFCLCKSNEPADFTICIDCNGEVHMVCADLFFFQKPSKNGFIPQKDLPQHAKSRLRKMPLTKGVCLHLFPLPRQNCLTEVIAEGVKGGEEVIINCKQRDY